MFVKNIVENNPGDVFLHSKYHLCLWLNECDVSRKWKMRRPSTTIFTPNRETNMYQLYVNTERVEFKGRNSYVKYYNYREN